MPSRSFLVLCGHAGVEADAPHRLSRPDPWSKTLCALPWREAVVPALSEWLPSMAESDHHPARRACGESLFRNFVRIPAPRRGRSRQHRSRLLTQSPYSANAARHASQRPGPGHPYWRLCSHRRSERGGNFIWQRFVAPITPCLFEFEASAQYGLLPAATAADGTPIRRPSHRIWR